VLADIQVGVVNVEKRRDAAGNPNDLEASLEDAQSYIAAVKPLFDRYSDALTQVHAQIQTIKRSVEEWSAEK
jgi:hypothetical protein